MKAQINLRLPDDLRKAAKRYAKAHKYKNLQELVSEAMREKVMERQYDETFTPKEVALIDKIIEASILKGRLHTEKELAKALK